MVGAQVRKMVLVADDHALVREGLKAVIVDLLGNVRFCEAGDGDSLAQVARRAGSIHLAVIGLGMPGMHAGLRLTEVVRQHPATPIVVVSASTSPDVVRRTLNLSSVFAFVAKGAPIDQLRSALEAAMQSRKLAFTQPSPDRPSRGAALTPRQEEVRALLRQGMSNKLIASTLGIREGTVKNHITEILRALSASNRTQAAHLSSDP